MRLTQYSNFAIRVLMHAALRGAKPSPVPDIAKAFGVSYNHMKKAAAELCRLGYLQSVRGRSGGVRLARNPCDIRIGDVTRATEGKIVLVECFDLATNSCPLQPDCELRPALHEAVEAFFAALNRYTLDDLIRHPRRLSALLRLDGDGVGDGEPMKGTAAKAPVTESCFAEVAASN